MWHKLTLCYKGTLDLPERLTGSVTILMPRKTKQDILIKVGKRTKSWNVMSCDKEIYGLHAMRINSNKVLFLCSWVSYSWGLLIFPTFNQSTATVGLVAGRLKIELVVPTKISVICTPIVLILFNCFFAVQGVTILWTLKLTCWKPHFRIQLRSGSISEKSCHCDDTAHMINVKN